MKILIIEDEPLLSDSLRSLLNAHGYDTDAAFDGETGLEYALLGIYDLIILDVMLPAMSGCEVAKRLRSAKKGMPILMLTARTSLDDRIEGLNCGADYYLGKPFDTRELLASADSFTDEEAAQKEEIGITLYLDNDAFPQTTIKLYRYDGSTCLAAIDGKSVALVPRSQTVSLIEAVNSIVLNKNSSDK